LAEKSGDLSFGPSESLIYGVDIIWLPGFLGAWVYASVRQRLNEWPYRPTLAYHSRSIDSIVHGASSDLLNYEDI
jgi:hypothetical protein